MDKPGFPFGETNRDRLKAALLAGSVTVIGTLMLFFIVAGVICLATHN